MAVADVNGDGIPDLVVANKTSSSVSVLLGNGDGTFQAQQTFAAGPGPTSVAVGDVNGDGNPDIAVADYSGSTVSVLLGNGNGTFQAQQTFTSGAAPYAVTMADVNGDGKPDLAVANYGGFSVSVLLGNGDGTFQAAQTFVSTGAGPDDVAAGDVNGDGRLDLAVVNFSSGTAKVILGSGKGNFTGQVYTISNSSSGPATHFVVSSTPTSVVAGGSATFTVTAEDVNNNIASSYTGTVAFSSSDTAATLPANSTLSAGVGVFTATLKTAGTQTLSATDTVTSSLTGASSPIAVTSGATSHFAFSTPSSVSAGTGFTFTVTAEDQFNNLTTGYTGTVAVSSTDSAASLVPPSSTLAAGVGTFSATLITAGNQTLTARDTVAATLTGASKAIAVSPTAATHLVLGGVPATIGAGTGFTLTVTAEDQFNNTATSYTGTVALTTGDTAATLVPSSKALTSGSGTFRVTFETSGTQVLTATDTHTSSLTAVSNPIAVSSAGVTHYALSSTPSSTTAGASFNLTVTAEDTFNNIVTAYSGTVVLSSTDTAASLVPSVSTLTGGVGVFTITLKTPGSQTVTARDEVVTGLTATTSAITVSVGAVTHFAVTGAPSSLTAGTAFGFTVTAQDAFNNTVGGYSGTVVLSSSDPAAVFVPARSVLLNGQGIFNVTLKTAGTQTLTAQDSVSSTVVGTSGPIAVHAGAATHYLIAGTPSSLNAGTPFAFTVTAQDAFNNTVSGYAGTVRFSSNDTGATLPPASTLSAGVGTFSATLITAGSRTLTAADTVTSSIASTSSPITVLAGVATRFSVNVPGSITAGQLLVFTVTAQDRYNNTATGYTGTVAFTTTASQAVLSDPSTLTNGVGVFGGVLKTAGNQTIFATDSVASTLTGASGTIVVSPAALQRLMVTGPAGAGEGTPFSITVTAVDQYGNAVPSYTGTVHFSATDTAAVLPPASTLTSGVGIFSVTLKTGGNQTVSAADTVNSSLSGSITIPVGAGAATHFGFSAVGSITAGNSVIFTVTALDQFNGVATGYTGTVHFSSSDTQAGLPANTTLTGGSGVFVASLKTAGSQIISATDTLTSSVTGGSSTIVVSPGPAKPLRGWPPSACRATRASRPPTLACRPCRAVSPPPACRSRFNVMAEDQFNNTAPTYTGTVQFASSDSGAALPASGTLSGGVGTFSATLITPGNQTIDGHRRGQREPHRHQQCLIVRGLVVTSFSPTPSGFTISFNEPFVASTVNLYTTGSLPDDVILATTNTQVSVRGSLVINAGGTSFTFVKTGHRLAPGHLQPHFGPPGCRHLYRHPAQLQCRQQRLRGRPGQPARRHQQRRQRQLPDHVRRQRAAGGSRHPGLCPRPE